MKKLILLFSFFLLLGSAYPGKNNSTPEGAGLPPNDPPTWNTTPSPVFTLGFSSSYNIVPDHATDPENDSLTIVNEVGCTLPAWITIDNVNDELDYDGTGSAISYFGCVFSVDDGTNPPVDSLTFAVVIQDIPASGTMYERDFSGDPRSGNVGAND